MQMSFYVLLVLHVAEGCTLQNERQTNTIIAYKRGSALLPCYCTDQHATPGRFTWKKHRSTWKEISSESDQYRDRVQWFNDLSPANLSLLISHLTEEDGGDYQCYLEHNEYVYIRLIFKVAPTATTTSGIKCTTRPVTSTSTEGRISSQNKAVFPVGPPAANSSLIICASVGVLLLLMVFGGICWSYRARQGQMKRCERKAGLVRDQETQNCSEGLRHTAISEPTDEESQKQDDVTYSTVVHIKASTPASTVMGTEDGDTTEYACIKLN
ncbi:uncharacterized protein [Salminus brasiliensis]|uniref:uncharacterized protein isoform X1 n=1 Tax=Salminus brasiliensis TaxID=930266 RepID=UPI003B8308F3